MPAQEAFRSIAGHALAKGGEPIKIIGVLCNRAPFLAEMKYELQAERYSKNRLRDAITVNPAVLVAKGQAGSSMFSQD